MKTETKKEPKQEISKLKKVKNRLSLVFYLTLFIFLIISFTAGLIFLVYYILIESGVIIELNFIWAGFALLFLCIVISTFLVGGLGNRILFGSLRQIINASKAVAAGDFTQRLEPAREKETAELCVSFNEMVDRLGKNQLLARDFISNISHQFRNPLASISGYAQLIQSDDITEEERREYAEIIRDKSISLSHLVNDILELSKIENGSDDFKKSVFQADEVLYKVLLSYDSAFKDKNIELVLDIQPAKCYGNGDLISEMFSNLIENAVKFSRDGGKIAVSLYESDGNAVFKVSDNGAGMSEETASRAFERFYRGNEAADTEGSGLGLALVEKIVKIHGGSVDLRSTLGKGTVITAELPADLANNINLKN